MKSVITPKMFGAVFRNSGTIDQDRAQQSIILKGNAATEGGLALSFFGTTPGFHMMAGEFSLILYVVIHLGTIG